MTLPIEVTAPDLWAGGGRRLGSVAGMATQHEVEPERVDLGPCRADLHRPRASDRVVLLPGAGYSMQAPLLWFARRLALARAAGALAVLDALGPGDEPFAWALDRARRALDVAPAGRQVVIGKSLASAAAGLVAERGLAALWLTPLLDQPMVVEGLARAAAPTWLVGGTLDPTWRPSALPPGAALEVIELDGVDHGLEVPGDPIASLDTLRRAVAAIDRFLGVALAG
jgi:hypothetical protein